jgi:hypothetical protein
VGRVEICLSRAGKAVSRLPRGSDETIGEVPARLGALGYASPLDDAVRGKKGCAGLWPCIAGCWNGPELRADNLRQTLRQPTAERSLGL